MQKSLIATALMLALPAAAEEPHAPPPAAPDPELLVFLGEIGGEDANLIFYMDTRAGKQAMKPVEKEDPKEVPHE